MWDTTLNSNEYSVGWIRSTVEAVRKSGAEAWSSRVIESVVEDSLEGFERQAVSGRDDIGELPFWRILYFKKLGGPNNAGDFEVVWGQLPEPPNVRGHALSGSPCSQCGASPCGYSSDASREGTSKGARECSEAEHSPERAEGHHIECDMPFMPDCIWCNVMAFCGNRELAALEATCSELRAMVDSFDIWKQKHETTFGCRVDLSAAECRRQCLSSEVALHVWSTAASSQANSADSGTSVAKLCGSSAMTASGSNIRVWDVESDRRIGMLSGHARAVTALDFCDELAVSGDAQGGVKIWNLEELKLRRALKMHGGRVTGAAVLGGGVLATCASDGYIKIFDASSANSIVSAQAATEDSDFVITCMETMSSGRTLVVGDAGGQIWTCDVETGTSSTPFIVGGRAITSVSASGIATWRDAGSPVVAAGSGDMASLIDLRGGTQPVMQFSHICDLLLDNRHGVAEEGIVGVHCGANELIVAHERGVGVWDIRAARSAGGVTWRRSAHPARSSMATESSVLCMAVSSGRVLLGLAEEPCGVWDSTGGDKNEDSVGRDATVRKKTRKPKGSNKGTRGRYPKRQTR